MIDRKTNIWINPEELDTFQKELYLANGDTGIKDFQAALGRLILYAPQSENYRNININIDCRNKEMIATFKNDQDVPRFTMGAVYRPATHEWTFHS